MSAPTSLAKTPLIELHPKGKNVQFWAGVDLLPALDRALDQPDGSRMKEGTYARLAVEEKLKREGFLADNKRGLVAARASELAAEFGDDVVAAKLDELVREQLQPAAREVQS